ncbi:MAG: ATP-binding protein [Candidatus Omnitrophota bacterium]
MLIICCLIIFTAILAAYGYYLNKRYQKKIDENVKIVKDVELQLVQMEKMASVGVLAAGIAHEVNNPLGFLISNLESLKDYARALAKIVPLDNPKNKTILEDLSAISAESLEGALRIKKIVSDLRTFSKQSESAVNLVDINQILESTLSIVWNEIKFKIAVVKDYQAKTQVFADSTQLSQVFLNLLINASQAIPEKGTVTLSTNEDADNVYIKVSDTGPGIAPEVLPKIFDPFFSTKKTGSGLGLSVSYNIIKSHKGQIKAESAPGKGTTFTISLPKKQGQEEK